MQKILKKYISYLGLILVVYQFAIGWFGTPPGMKHRPLSLGILLFILFLTFDIKGERGKKIAWYDYALAFGALGSCLYTFSIYKWFTIRLPYVTPLSMTEIIMGLILILSVMEASRRIMGWVMPSIASIGILYVLLGKNLPGAFGHRGFSVADLVENLYLTSDGVWGSPIHISLTVVFMFVIFSAALASTGMGDFFMDFSLAITGKYSGGTAKTAVVSSGLMGMIQGSSVTNVLTTGTFTIPAMKKAGFPDYYAAAVETVASCGGQIMPPVMGAAAFIMADMTGIPYSKIIVHAIIPAILYYFCCMMQVHFRSKKLDMKGMPKDEIPKAWPLVRQKGMCLFPILLMIIFLIRGYTAMRAGFMSISASLIVGLFLSKDYKKLSKDLFEELKEVPYTMASIAPAVAVAGIIVGVLFMTGLGERLSAVVIRLSMGNLLLGLFLTMIVAIILGMGMPTSAAYILLGTLIAPGLIKLGISTIQAHMFVFYFACMSMLTPPVAIAAYAAASLAKSEPNKTGFAAWKLAIAAFIVPFMFAYGDELLLIGNPMAVFLSTVTAIIGCVSLASAIEGYLIMRLKPIEQIILGIASLTMMKPGLLTDLVGLTLIIVILMAQIKRKKELFDTQKE